MTRIVLLDSGPLGLLSNPRASTEGTACRNWLSSLLDEGAQVRVPEIADYEIRRELLRAGKTTGIRRLDALGAVLGYLPLTTLAMRRAAEFWAEARRHGRPTADPKALDADMILAAQATLIGRGDDVVVATMNVGHLARFVTALRWEDITA